MFPMTMTIHNTEQLNAVIAALNVAVEQPAPQAAPVKEAPKAEAAPVKEAPKAEAAPVKEAPKAEAAPVKENTQAPATKTEAAPAASEAPSYQDTATAITKLSRTKGRDVAVAVLAKFGVGKLPDVKPEQYAAVIAAVDEAMGE